MTDPETLQALQRVLDQLQEQQAQQRAAQAGAYVVLARHLAMRGHADLTQLARDLKQLRQSQPDEHWQDELDALIGALRLARVPPAKSR